MWSATCGDRHPRAGVVGDQRADGPDLRGRRSGFVAANASCLRPRARVAAPTASDTKRRQEHGHHDAAVGRDPPEDLVGDVARVVAHGPGARVREDHRRLRDVERGRHRRRRDVAQVDEHAEAVHLAHHLAPNGVRPPWRGASVAASAQRVVRQWVSVMYRTPRA